MKLRLCEECAKCAESAYLTWKAGAVDVPPCSVCGRFDVAVREVQN